MRKKVTTLLEDGLSDEDLLRVTMRQWDNGLAAVAFMLRDADEDMQYVYLTSEEFEALMAKYKEFKISDMLKGYKSDEYA